MTPVGVGVDLPSPPPPDLETGGGYGWVQLFRARDDIDAHLVCGRLQQHGIETTTVKDHSSGAWLYGGSNPWAPVAVLVRKVQLEDARIVLAEISLTISDSRPAPRNSRVPVIWWVTAIAVGVVYLVLTATGVVFRWP